MSVPSLCSDLLSHNFLLSSSYNVWFSFCCTKMPNRCSLPGLCNGHFCTWNALLLPTMSPGASSVSDKPPLLTPPAAPPLPATVPCVKLAFELCLPALTALHTAWACAVCLYPPGCKGTRTESIAHWCLSLRGAWLAHGSLPTRTCCR